MERRPNKKAVDLGAKLNELSGDISSLQSQKSRAEGSLEEIIKRRNELEARCREMGYEPKDLAEVITAKENTLDTMMQTVETALRNVEASRDAANNPQSDSA